jgi:hypothetical protein
MSIAILFNLAQLVEVKPILSGNSYVLCFCKESLNCISSVFLTELDYFANIIVVLDCVFP